MPIEIVHRTAQHQDERIEEHAMAADKIVLEPDVRGSYKFSFSSPRGEISGRVSVGTEGPPDRRSEADKQQAAKNQILALSRELGEACAHTMAPSS